MVYLMIISIKSFALLALNDREGIYINVPQLDGGVSLYGSKN